ncbi:MAG: winged helix-turn-helix transcriptional regulator [Bacteroidia bacterium]|nr:winged helix-turn-helix transcriptional regulator [Bacteroidia bacterium]MCZ2247843.1 MarR family winged helix-turn-helix transcriptional regulator [Bacteroidia bacterium]
MQQKQLPIGYYLKLVDNCLTRGIDEIQSKHGLNRLEWQVLNSIYEKPGILKTEILELMKPLADFQVVESIFNKFIEKNQIEIKSNMLALTTLGKELHKSCFDSQQEFRKKAITNISETEYQTTISTLQKMIANLS